MLRGFEQRMQNPPRPTRKKSSFEPSTSNSTNCLGVVRIGTLQRATRSSNAVCNTSISSSRRTGLARNASTPREYISFWSTSPKPLTKMMVGTVSPALARRRTSVTPSMTGMRTSVISTSTGCATNAASASSPFDAVRSLPSPSTPSHAPKMLSSIGSSSTRRILASLSLIIPPSARQFTGFCSPLHWQGQPETGMLRVWTERQAASMILCNRSGKA